MNLLENINNFYTVVFTSDVVTRLNQVGYYYLVILFIFFLLSLLVANLIAYILTICLKVVNFFAGVYVKKSIR